MSADVAMLHDEAWGWFPFYPADYSKLVKDGSGNITQPIVGPMPLPLLTKLYWLSKTYDYDINIAYNFSQPSTYTPGHTDTDIGTLSGSGSGIIIPNGQGLSASLLPRQRVTAATAPSPFPSGLIIPVSNDGTSTSPAPPMNVVLAGTWTPGGTGLTPVPYNYNVQQTGFQFIWPSYVNTTGSLPYSQIAQDFTNPQDLYMACLINARLGGFLINPGIEGIVAGLSTARTNPGASNEFNPSGVTLTVTDASTGSTINMAPLKFWCYGDPSKLVMTGSINLTLNFWT
jgi:hypothetical protein